MLIGATTENPFFEVNAPLISRSRIVELEPLCRRRRPRRSSAARSTDERGLRRQRRRSTPDAEDAIVRDGRRRRARRAHDARARGRLRRARRADGARTRDARRTSREATPTRILPYDKTRRRPLRRHLGVHQVDARQRPRRGRLLARADGPRRRGPEVHRPPHAHLRLRGRRQRRPAGAAGRARRLQGRRVDRLARVPHQPGAGGHLPGARAQEQRLVLARSTRRWPRCATGPRAPVPNHLRDRHRPGCRGRTGRTATRTTTPRRWVEQRYLPDGLERGAFYQPAPRGWEAEREPSGGRARRAAPSTRARRRR